MEKITGWIKQHPYGTGAIVIGAILFIWLFFGRKAPAGSNVAGDYYAAQSSAAQANAAAGIAAHQSDNALSGLLSQDTTHAQETTTLSDAATTIGLAQAQAGEYSSLLNYLGQHEAATAAEYSTYINNYSALEAFIASPAAGASQGSEWGGLLPPPSLGAPTIPVIPGFSPPPAKAA